MYTTQTSATNVAKNAYLEKKTLASLLLASEILRVIINRSAGRAAMRLVSGFYLELI
jgi:hypothetical protein